MANDEVELLGSGRFLRLQNRNGWEYVERILPTGVVVLVAIVDEQRLLLVEQLRPAFGCPVIELPAGLAGDLPGQQHEALEIAARRELLEETGYEAAELSLLAEGPSSCGLCTEVISFYHARGLTRRGPGGGDASEDILVHEAPLADLLSWLERESQRGVLIDPRIYAGLALIGQPLR